jgi:uncharacterized Zn-finger protein
MDNQKKLDTSLSGIETDQQFNFKCKYCFKNLSSRQNLREHMYIHTEEKPYICTEVGCGQKFRQGSLLSLHKKIHLEVRKSQKKDKKNLSRCTYSKLTEMLKNTEKNFHSSLQTEEKIEWIKKIGLKSFFFLQNYMETHN